LEVAPAQTQIAAAPLRIAPLVIEPPLNAVGNDGSLEGAEASVRELIKAIAEGNTSAFAVFYEEWFDRALGLATSLTKRDESFCLDIVQDSMLRAIKSLRPSLGISSRTDLDRWMSRVVHTAAIDCLRKESRRRAREARLRETRVRDGKDSYATGAETPSDLEERIVWIREQLEQLAAADRELLMSRFAADRTIHAAATDAGLTPGAAAGRLARLMKRLQNAAKEFIS